MFESLAGHLARGADYAFDALGKAADVIGKTFDAAAKVADTAAKHAADGIKLAGDSVPDGSSNGASAAGEKANKLEQARKRYEEFRKIMEGMLANSVRTKSTIMIPACGLLWALPKESFESPVALIAFSALGIHMGIEAAEQFLEKIDNAGKPASSPEKTNNNQDKPMDIASVEQQIIESAKRKDEVTTAEITGAILGSIYDLPPDEQIEIMALFGGVMLSSYGLVDGLVRLDYAGKKLEMWQSSGSFFDKALEKTDLPGRAGRFLQSSVHTSFRVLPWVGAIAKFATVGRVFWHVAEGAGYIPHHSLDHVAFTERMRTWGGYGLAASAGLYVTTKLVEHTVYDPLKHAIKESPVIQSWRRSAQEMFIGLRMNIIADNAASSAPQARLPRPPITLVHSKPERIAGDKQKTEFLTLSLA